MYSDLSIPDLTFVEFSFLSPHLSNIKQGKKSHLLCCLVCNLQKLKTNNENQLFCGCSNQVELQESYYWKFQDVQEANLNTDINI